MYIVQKYILLHPKYHISSLETVDDQEALQKEMAEIQSEMPSWTKECLEFNESKDFVLDHRQKYNTKMAELEREIATTRVIHIKGYFQPVGCNVNCWLGPSNRSKQQFQ